MTGFYTRSSIFITLLVGLVNSLTAQGWVAGAAYGSPVYKSGYYESAASFGMAVRTPISIEKGPFVIGVGLFAGQTSGKNSKKEDFSSVEGWGAFVISLKDPFVIPFSLHAGAGILPTGMGVTAGMDAVLISSPITLSVSLNSALPLVDAALYFPHPAHLTRVYMTVSSSIAG
jgi:hypothetical protein